MNIVLWNISYFDMLGKLAIYSSEGLEELVAMGV